MSQSKFSIHFPSFFSFDEKNSAKQGTLLTESLSKKIFNISLFIILILMLGMSFSHGISGDEIDMNEYGKAILKYFTTFGSDKTVFNMPTEFDRDGVIKYYGGLFDLVCVIINTISPFEEFTTRHLLNAFVGFVGIYFTAKIILKFMNYQSAILAIWLLFLSPFFLGHAMNNPKDIPFATSYIIAIYFMIQFFERIKNLKKFDYLYLIISISIAINIRVGGILLIPYLLVFAGIHLMLKKYVDHEKLKPTTFIKPILIVGLSGYLAGSLLWPFGLQNPILNPIIALEQMNNFHIVVRQLFEGQRMLSDKLPWNYLPQSFIITNTVAVLIGLAFGFIFLYSFRKNKHASIIYFIVFTLLFPLIYIIITHANVYHSWRHILFIFPSAIILASFGWMQLSNLLSKLKMEIAGWGILIFLMLEPIYFIGNSFPNTITYHNNIVDGVQGAYSNYEIDYYYNSMKQCADWFLKNEYPKRNPNDTINVISNASHLMKQYFKEKKNIKVSYGRFLERNEQDWDYSFFHIALIPNEFVKSKKWLPATTLFEAKTQGLPLSAVIKKPSFYDVRAFNYLNEMKMDSAAFYFNMYLNKDPDNTCVLNALGKILIQTGNFKEADKIITHSYSIDSTDPDTKMIYGIMLVENKKLVPAKNIFDEIVRDFPNDKETYFYLAMAEKEMGRLDEALTHFDEAAKVEKFRSSCLKLMGDIYFEKGDKRKAVQLYKAAGYMD